LHDRLPVDDCPFGPPPWVTDSPTIDRVVVCHGDACAPNTLIDDDGRFHGHVDLGDLGVADRWADLAVATLSLSWNYGGSWEGELLDAYGVEPQPARIEHYRRQWDAADISSH
jgi:kanamycin kinase